MRQSKRERSEPGLLFSHTHACAWCMMRLKTHLEDIRFNDFGRFALQFSVVLHLSAARVEHICSHRLRQDTVCYQYTE